MNSRKWFLLVFFSLFSVFLSFAQAAERVPSSKKTRWEVERKKDPILDTTNIRAHLRATEEKKSLFSDGKFLVIRCRERKLDVIIVWGGIAPLGFSIRNARNDVIVRFDSATPETQHWSRSTGADSSFSPKPHEFMGLLAQHQKLAVRTFPTKGNSLTAVFDLSDAKPIVDEVLTASRK